MRDSTSAADGVSGAVRWVGAQRDVLAGDLSGRVGLQSLSGVSHLYALGPLEGLRGEVSIFDRQPSVSRVVEGSIAVDTSFGHRACFLVYASVTEWTDVALTFPVTGVAAVERAVVEAARRHGIDVTRPFPFLIQGRAARLSFHVLDKRDGLPHTPARHEQAKVPFALQDEPIDVLGFYSDRHQGIFTPKDANLHMHVRTSDGRASGHLDQAELAPGASLRLPRNRGGKDE